MKLTHTLTAICLTACTTLANAEVADVTVGGWYEGGYVTWTKADSMAYNVYVQEQSSDTWTQLDTELVREYATTGRADALGLTAGQYRFRIVPVQDGNELTAEATESDVFTATAYDRAGYAHFATASSTFNVSDGVGAYKNDGTLKDGAKVIYVTADNAKSVTADVITSSKGTTTTCTGLQAIISAYEKGQDTTPLDIRIIGRLSADDMDALGSSSEGLQVKGHSAYSEMNITIEGVGNDATIHGFGFLVRNAASVELRNFAIMYCLDDCVSLDTDNSNVWVHNLDLFYGQPGSASDQKKGDGTLDLKGDSKYITLSYNHLWDSGKASLCGMKSETGPNWITYHHNWFDHSDSRHPRVRTMSVHVYNNYYDGVAKYGVGATTGADVFVEANYFRNCKYPMLTSLQGSDVHNGVGSSDDTEGTFSNEDGGSIKAYGNYMTGQTSFEPYVAGDATYSQHFDAYVASSRDEQVPETVVALVGADTYSNFDTDATLIYQDYTVTPVEDVPALITGELGAGRCQKGDFQWQFSSSDDTNSEVDSNLSAAVQAYTSSLVGFFGQTIGSGSDDTTDTGSDTDTDDTTDDSSDSGTTTTPVVPEGMTTTYSYTLTSILPAAVVNEQTQNYSDTVEAVGGRFLIGAVSKITTSTVAQSGYSVKLDGNASATSTKYALVILDTPLALNDVISLTGYCTSNPSNDYGMSLYADRSGSPLASVYCTAKNTEETLNIAVTEEMVGLSSFYIFRNTDKSVYLSAVTVNSATTAITSVTTTDTRQPAVIYNLAGQRVTSTTPGQVYIINAKKYVMKE